MFRRARFTAAGSTGLSTLTIGRRTPRKAVTRFVAVIEDHADADGSGLGADRPNRSRLGSGGADGTASGSSEGHGFVGLADRLAVLDGQLRVESPAGGGTLVAAGIALHD
jgi:hypothetical protein